MRVLSRPALAGVGLGACLGLACEPQDIFLFDPVAVVDAGPTARPRPVTPDVVPTRAADASRPVQPPCDSSACERCVAMDLCRVGTSPLLCHPRTGECSFWCDPAAGVDGACPGDQECDAELGVCVECLTRAHCTTGERPECDVPNGACVECVVSDDCPSARPACDTATRRCVPCLANSDCAVIGQVCQIETSSCVGCRNDADCAGREDSRCLPSELRCVECLSDSDCRSDPEKPLCSSEFECDD